MSCCCKNYPPMIRAESVTVSGGITTITLSSGIELKAGNIYKILLTTAIPDNTDGTQLVVAVDTASVNVMQCNGNYFRPLPLRSRTVITMQYFGDPAHFQILHVSGACCRC